jgi:uncharacterized repeat protein (TIGR02059 family)
MKNTLIILLLCISVAVKATIYYVAPTGNDGNPGTITQPWATWQYGFNHIAPGDILYIRGGTYTPTVITTNHSRYCAVVVDSKSGTSSNSYQVFAYPGETPVLDGSNITGTSYERYGIVLYNSSYWHLMGLTVTNVKQPTSGGVGGQGILIQGDNPATHNTIENCVAHHNGGPGMGTRAYVNETLFLNCDCYSNWDAYSSSPGGNADGFDCGYSYGDAIIRFTGCRSWLNGDDGFDLYQGTGFSGIYYLTNCWAWHMGYYPDGVTQGGDGSGFKYGQGQSSDGVVRRFSYNCIAYDNLTQGFTQNEANVKMVFYNCVAYHNNVQGFDFQWNNVADVLRNNISYNNGSTDIFQSNQTRDHNSWDSKVTVSNADFVSLDGTQLALPRKADGSLPDITFLHLASGSGLIDAGVDVGLPYSGSAPDLGAFEAQTGSAALIPVFSSAVVQNATPSLVEMTYNMTLANAVPAASAFSVLVNTVARTVSTVAVSGTEVQLTLSSAIKFGDLVTVNYTKPSANPLKSTTGGVATSISAQTVTNNLTNVTKDATPVTITMTIAPNHVHKILNVLLAYSSTPTIDLSPEIIRIFDLSGNLFVEKLLTTGATSIKIPLNLASGIYSVLMLASNVQMASQKIVVH